MINQIFTGTRNLISSFIFNGAGRGNNALATVKDLQTIIYGINSQIYYRPVDFMLTNNGAADPTYKLLVSGATDCGSNCNCASNDCGCPGTVSDPTCGKEASAQLIVGVTRTNVGLYSLALDPKHKDRTNRGIAIWTSNLSNKDHQVIVGKLVGDSITIATLDSGALSDTVLDQTVFQVKFYVYK